METNKQTRGQEVEKLKRELENEERTMRIEEAKEAWDRVLAHHGKSLSGNRLKIYHAIMATKECEMIGRGEFNGDASVYNPVLKPVDRRYAEAFRLWRVLDMAREIENMTNDEVVTIVNGKGEQHCK